MVVNMDGLSGYLDFCILNDDQVLMAGVFDRAKTKVRALGCKFGSYSVSINYRTYHTKNKDGWNVDYKRIPLGKGRDQFFYALATTKEIGERYFITSPSTKEDDLYNFLMKNYKLPLLREWMNPILDAAMDIDLVKKLHPRVIFGKAEKDVLIKGHRISPRELEIYDVSTLTEDSFSKLVSDMLRKKAICICQKNIPEMKFKNFDDYISTYGSALVKSLESEITPLCDLKGTVDTLALKTKRLFPQQAACVNGIIALKKAGIHYGIMNEGMGVGKTIQGISTIEAYFIEKFLHAHPDKTLVDAYQDGVINYRNIIIAPGHLTEKWADEIRKEVPFAKVTILRDFSQLIELRERGKRRKGKEYFILSKDFCKLGSQLSPIPTTVKSRYITAHICKDCYSENGAIHYMVGPAKSETCPECLGHNSMDYQLSWAGRHTGLVCPHCGNLLLKTKNLIADVSALANGDERDIVLSPSDFSKHKTENATCYLCGDNMWGVNVKPLCTGNAPKTVKPPKWRKISYFKNARKASTETAFVLQGHEDAYVAARGLKSNEWHYTSTDYGPRKTAPAAFIKKYLKGYFDFAVLDECHKFEGAGTAQANAAHALIKASDFTLGLTGTISNGTAGSFFWLLYMLDPRRMLEKGYSYSSGDCLKFCREYGSIETLYEYAGIGETYNSSSRGRQLRQPKIKPGISPMLFVDFLLDRCVMLDITDLSKYLPSLKENVIMCQLPTDIAYSYRNTISQLKELTHDKEGRTAMSSMLTFGLAYPDKPYNRTPITSAFTEGEIIATVDSYDKYESLDNLLPKEAKLVEIINSEMAEGRNCFVYASFTGEAENNITFRLQQIIEKYCNLKNRVQIIQASSPEASKREAFIKKKAAEGVRVFITNPKCVETGLDFCFSHEGKNYNYPTLIFMQMGYEMSVIWQASRRHYRLNQREECRTYYLAYEGTLQAAALEIMAAKQVATSAIQGKFSSEGLAAMAKGVDTRTQLATALAKNDMSDRKTLENMFDALNQQNNAADDSYGDYIPPKTYYELIGSADALESEFGISMLEQTTLFDVLEAKAADSEATAPSKEDNPEVSEESFFGDLFNDISVENIIFNASIVEPPKKTVKNKKKVLHGQTSILDLFAS